MKSLLDVAVSCFKNYDTPSNPFSINLLTWLTSDKYSETVSQIRQMKSKPEREELKATLPAITPSGTFSYRESKKLIQHSGFIQFDIDFKENSHITNYNELKQHLSNIPNVAYCGLSVSGTGYWGLIPIEFRDKHKEHFKSLYEAFGRFGIVLDKAPANVASLRGYSYDPDAYFNHNATIFSQFEAAPVIAPRQSTDNSSAADTDTQIVEACIRMIYDKGADITTSYQFDWLPIGSNFAGTFGEAGREYFHQVSQFHPAYDTRKTDRQYDNCLKHSSGAPSIGTFLSRCAAQGIYYKELLPDKPEAEENTKRLCDQPTKPTKPVNKKPPPEDKPLTEYTFEELAERFDFDFALAQLPYVLYDPECTLLKSYEEYYNQQLQQAS
jgi:hypothetical protein